MPAPVYVSTHPLVQHKLARLRAADTRPPEFRALVAAISRGLLFELTRELRLAPVRVQTPLTGATCQQIADRVGFVPVLRAGLGMLNGMMKLMPTAEVGFLGMVRDETSLLATTYADRLPHNLKDRQVFVLDPMLATGGTLVAAINLLLERGARDVTAICLLAAPEGLRHMEESFAGSDANVTVVTASLDERLNEKGYIVPGLGDAGDRQFGTG